MPVVVAVDDALAAGIVESLLESAGYPVVRAEHTGQVLTLATRHHARVVVLDLNSSHRILAVFDRPKTIAKSWGRDGEVKEWNPSQQETGTHVDIGQYRRLQLNA